MRYGVIDLVLRYQRDAQIVVGIGVIRLERKGTFVMRYGVIDSVLRYERDAQIIVDTGRVRVEDEGAFVMRHGVIDPALIIEKDAQVVMSLHIIRVEGQGALVMRHGVVDPALGLEGITQMVVIGRIVFPELDRLTDQFDGYVRTATLMGEEPEQLQPVGMLRLDRRDHPEELSNLNRATSLMMPFSVIKHSLNSPDASNVP